MEWPRNDAMFLKENLDNVFVYQPRENRAVYQFAGDEVCRRFEEGHDARRD